MTGSVLWSAEEAVAAAGGQVQGNWSVSGLSIDTRTLQPGDLFVALPGENVDGHRFVAKALEAGAGAAMVSQVPEGIDANAPLLIVPDVTAGLENLARSRRAQCPATVIGVTGSVGKTSTKEMLQAVCRAFGKTHATLGNLNNHLGLPLTLARMPRDTDYAIIEMGMNHAGEIASLTRIACPHVAIITTVEAVHLEFFDSVAGIADAKAEIFEGVQASGAAVIPVDSPWSERLIQHAKDVGVSRILSFGKREDADLCLLTCTPEGAGMRVQAGLHGKTLNYYLPLAGEHMVLNSLAVLVAVSAVGMDIQKAAEALESFQPRIDGRGKEHCVQLNGQAVTLVDDSYNASPASMRAAFKVLAARPGTHRRIAVLGDMLELGGQGASLHAELAESLESCGISLVFCAGPLMHHLYDALPAAMRGKWVADASELAPVVIPAMQEGDMVLVKGSHGSRLYAVVADLLAASSDDSEKDASSAHAI